jgi:hypothetical protein
MQKAGDKLGEKDTDKEINKEKQKLGIKEASTYNLKVRKSKILQSLDRVSKEGGKININDPQYKELQHIKKQLKLKGVNEALSTNSKLPKLVGQSIAHLELYLELVNNINKIPSGKEVPYMVKIQSKTASKSLPPVIKDLRKPGIFEQINEDDDKAYAIGMSVAKKKMNDEPPLEKKTIKKAHDIADKIMANEVHPSKDTYERITRGK